MSPALPPSVSASSAPLAGIRVVECGGTLASAYAGRLLADLGAEVVLVQPPAGDALWGLGPRLTAQGRDGEPGAGALGAYLHVGKRPVVAERESAELLALATTADIVLADLDGPLVDAEWARQVADAAPGVIVVQLSDFGVAGPWAGRAGGDLVVLALAGVLSVMSAIAPDGSRQPVRYRTELAHVFAGCYGVLAALGALYARSEHGGGELIDVTALAAAVTATATALPAWTYSGAQVQPDGQRAVSPWGIYEGLDGRFLMQITEDAQWRSLLRLLGDPVWGELEMFATNAGRIEQSESVEALVASALVDVEVDDFLERARHEGVPACRVHTPLEALDWAHLRARGFFREIDVLGAGTVEVPSPPWRMAAASVGSSAVAVPPGVPGAAIAGAHELLDRAPVPVAPSGAAPRAAPLAGIRVVDLTWVWAGPFAAMMLAHLGAEVVKVESLARPDVSRLIGPFAEDVPGLDRSGFFNQFNLGKKSVQLDPTSAEGKRVLGDLIATADLIVDNMRPGALGRLGFPPERLRELAPAIVPVSLTGFGSDGPDAGNQAYGSLIDALSGNVAATGAPGGDWTEVSMSTPDPCAGLHAAIAMVAALVHRRATGSSTPVDCSMVEAWIAALPAAVLHAAVTGENPPLVGCRDEQMAPHDVYRCAGDYEWVALAIRDDDELRRLLGSIGAAGQPVPSDRHDGRCVDVEALDRLIRAWTIDREAAEVERCWTGLGLAAARVRRVYELAGCEQLESLGFFADLDHPVVGNRRLSGAAWTCARSPVGPFRRAPTFGEHTDEVLAAIGYDDEHRSRLRSAGVLR